MQNTEIAKVFYQIANILDIKGDSFFKINAYRKGAQIVEALSRELSDVYKENDSKLEKISGIGEGLEKKILEMIETGECDELNKLKKGFPEGLFDILNLRGVGPKKVKLFYEQLGITDLNMLEIAAKSGALRGLERMGEKSEMEIISAINDSKEFNNKRFLIDHAMKEALEYINYLKNLKIIEKIQYAGSLRRFKETIGDIDILVTLKDSKKNFSEVIDYYTSYPKIYNILSKGDTKSSVILISGIQVDLRVVEDDSFGAALQYFTGDKNHNIRIREIAKSMGLKVSEYGVFDGETKIASKSEEDVYKILGLPYIYPELRKNNGEFEYIEKHGCIPSLVEENNLKGDLHIHSKYSDGHMEIEEIVKLYFDNGFKYIAIADHYHNLNLKDFEKQFKEIDDLNKKYEGKFYIFKSSEVDINIDGELDIDLNIASKFDFLIASCHGVQGELSKKQQTDRILRALSNKNVKILAHPTGRIINKRPEFDMDLEKIIKECVKNNVILEINSSPHRLDLNDKNIKLAKSLGAKFSINSDLHKLIDFENFKFGVGQSRRGWLNKDDVVNCLSVQKIKSLIKA